MAATGLEYDNTNSIINRLTNSPAASGDLLYRSGGLVSTPGDTQDYAAGVGRNARYAPSAATSGASLPEGETPATVDSTGHIIGNVTPYGEQNMSFLGGLTQGLGAPILATVGAEALAPFFAAAPEAAAAGGTAGADAAGGAAAGGGAEVASGVDAINAAAPGSISMGLTDAQVAGSAFDASAAGAAAGVEAINSAAPGAITKGLTDAEIAGSVLAPANAAVAGVDAINSAAPGTITRGLTDAEVAGSAFAPAAADAAAATGAGGGTVTTGAGGTAILDATTPTVNLSPETAALLGIPMAPTVGDLPIDPALSGGVQTTTGGIPGGAPELGGAFSNGATGAFDQSGSEGVFGPDGEPLYESPVDASNILKTLGLSPIQAGLLGLTGLNMANKPKLPAAGQTLSNTATTGTGNAQSVIQSGGTSGPMWQTQKGAIDSAIDQQIKEQTEAMLQQAVNSGVGADSQVTKQQIDKLKTNLETKRQELYLAAQSQNVSAALQELGISDQALAHVTQAQFAADANAQQTASMMAELALLLGSKSG